MIFSRALLVLLRIDGRGGGGEVFAWGFLLPAPPSVQRQLPSIIRPDRSTAAASASSLSRGMPPESHRIQSICTPMSVKATRRLSLSSSSSGGFGNSAATSSQKKKARPSSSLSKYKPWIRRYMHNPKHLCSVFRVAYVCYSYSSPWWYGSDPKGLIKSIGVLGLIYTLGSNGKHYLLG